MKDLGTLSSDYWSIAVGINDQGQVVGVSANADFSIVLGFVRQNGKLVDLNTLIAGSTSRFLMTAGKIDASGEIDGVAIDPNTGYIHGYLAIPTR